MVQTITETSSGFPHLLTEKDRVKGRSMVTARRVRANRLNPLKHGKFSKHLIGDFLNCNSCSLQKSCIFFKKNNSCSVISLTEYKSISSLWKADPSEFMKEIMRSMIELNISIKANGSTPKNISKYIDRSVIP